MKSKAKSIAFASAVNTEEPSGIRKELQWFPDITAHPTFSASLVGWLVGWFGFNGPLRQYFSLYSE